MGVSDVTIEYFYRLYICSRIFICPIFPINYTTALFLGDFINNGALFLGSYIVFFELYCLFILFFLRYQSPNAAKKLYTASKTQQNHGKISNFPLEIGYRPQLYLKEHTQTQFNNFTRPALSK